MVFIAALFFVLAAIKAAHWLGGPTYWFWGFLAFAAWVLAGAIPLWVPGRRQPPPQA